MPNYGNGIVYKIVDTRDDSNAYVGSSTLPLRARFCQHNCNSRKFSGRAFYSLLRKLPAGTFEPRLIERWPCSNSEQLRKREQYWIDTLAPAHNTNKAYNGLPLQEQMRACWHRHRMRYNKRQREKVACVHCGTVVNRSGMCQHMRSIRCTKARAKGAMRSSR